MYVISYYDEEAGWMYAAFIEEKGIGFINDLNQSILFISIKETIDWWKEHAEQFNNGDGLTGLAIRKIVFKAKAALGKKVKEEKEDGTEDSGV